MFFSFCRVKVFRVDLAAQGAVEGAVQVTRTLTVGQGAVVGTSKGMRGTGATGTVAARVIGMTRTAPGVDMGEAGGTEDLTRPP